MRLAWREAILAFKRAPVLSVLSVTTIAFSLFAFGLFGLVALNIRHQLSQLEERVEIRAFVIRRDERRGDQRGNRRHRLVSRGCCRSKLVSPEEALSSKTRASRAG